MTISDLISFIEQNRCKGRGASFGWDGEELQYYIQWADIFNYLFVSTEGDKFTGVAIMYPLNEEFHGNPEDFFDFSNREETDKSDLCIMDFISTSENSKKDLVKQLKERYPNWEAQDKWALRFGNPKKITNKYINLLNN